MYLVINSLKSNVYTVCVRVLPTVPSVGYICTIVTSDITSFMHPALEEVKGAYWFGSVRPVQCSQSVSL